MQRLRTRAHAHPRCVGTTELASGAMYVKQFWIQGQRVIAPNVYVKKRPASNVVFYDYPAVLRTRRTQWIPFVLVGTPCAWARHL